MYLQHFGLREPPFTLTPDTSFFFPGSSYQEALNTLLVAARSGEGFVKITGEVGNGKTLLCRKFLALLKQEPPKGSSVQRYKTAYILNPYLDPRSLLLCLADEFNVELDKNVDLHLLQKELTLALLGFARSGMNVVVCLDEAQAMPLESLEVLRLLTNLETEKRKLMQVVLFGQPELNEHLRQKSIRQLRQRISFEYELKGLRQNELDYYLRHRLTVAQYPGVNLFSHAAVGKLYRITGGTPRLVNIVANKALMLAYGEGKQQILPKHIRDAGADTPETQRDWLPVVIYSAVAVIMLIVIGIAYQVLK